MSFWKKPPGWMATVEEEDHVSVSPIKSNKTFYGKYSISLWGSPEPAKYDYKKCAIDLSNRIPSKEFISDRITSNDEYCIEHFIPNLRLGILPVSKRMLFFIKAMEISIVVEEKAWRGLLGYLQLDSSNTFIFVNETTSRQISSRYLSARKAPPQKYVVGLIKSSRVPRVQSISLEIDDSHLSWVLSEFLRLQPRKMITLEYE